MEYPVVIETPVFSRERVELLTDDEFRLLQEHLLIFWITSKLQVCKSPKTEIY